MIPRILLLLALFMPALTAWSSPLSAVLASDLIMARSHETFPEAMLTLQTSIREHGYTVARVQRIDIGLPQFRGCVVQFQGKVDECFVAKGDLR